jgi:acyl CoA:acetate/3-ketoacid CoA transferase alpha subunit
MHQKLVGEPALSNAHAAVTGMKVNTMENGFIIVKEPEKEIHRIIDESGLAVKPVWTSMEKASEYHTVSELCRLGYKIVEQSLKDLVQMGQKLGFDKIRFDVVHNAHPKQEFFEYHLNPSSGTHVF